MPSAIAAPDDAAAESRRDTVEGWRRGRAIGGVWMKWRTMGRRGAAAAHGQEGGGADGPDGPRCSLQARTSTWTNSAERLARTDRSSRRAPHGASPCGQRPPRGTSHDDRDRRQHALRVRHRPGAQPGAFAARARGAPAQGPPEETQTANLCFHGLLRGVRQAAPVRLSTA